MSQVHLTFDNGPHPEVTPRVLQTLAQHGVTATFFVLGRNLATDEGARVARDTVAAGHGLGNHSYTHETPLGDDPRPDAVERELEATQRLLERIHPALDGSGSKLFRPFGGGGKLGPHLLSQDSVEWLTRGGHTCVLWSSVPGDWLDAAGWVHRALRHIEASDETTVVVLHDILPDAMRYLGAFIESVRARGHTFSVDVPADLMPIVDGVPQPGLDKYVGAPGTRPRAAKTSPV